MQFRTNPQLLTDFRRYARMHCWLGYYHSCESDRQDQRLTWRYPIRLASAKVNTEKRNRKKPLALRNGASKKQS